MPGLESTLNARYYQGQYLVTKVTFIMSFNQWYSSIPDVQKWKP